MLLYYLSILSALAAFAFVVLSLASGLLYISELIEEHSKLAKVLGQRAIYAILLLHGALYLSEQLPFFHLLFSAACHLVYLQNFSSEWPCISLTSVTFIASTIMVIVDHFLWFSYFAQLTNAARHRRDHYYNYHTAPGPEAPSFAEIATFFGLCIWLVPLFLFLSLSANDNALPISGSGSSASSPHTPSPARVSLFRSIFSPPSLRRSSNRKNSQGIIARKEPDSPLEEALMNSNLQSLPPPPHSPIGSPHVTPRKQIYRHSSFESGVSNYQVPQGQGLGLLDRNITRRANSLQPVDNTP